MYEYKAEIIRWVDGDTVDMRVDLGFHMWVETRFRLHGINTPERGKPGFNEATMFAEGLAPAGATVLIRTYKSADKYGRWLVSLYNNLDGISLNYALVSSGLASVYMSEGKL